MAITCKGTWTPLSGSSQHLGLSEGGAYLTHLLGVIIHNDLCVSGGKPVLGVCFGVPESRDGLFAASMHASRKHPGRTEGRMVPRQVWTSWNSKASGETKGKQVNKYIRGITNCYNACHVRKGSRV